MALKKDSNKLNIEKEKSQNDDVSLNIAKEENKSIFYRDNYEKRLLYTAITRAKKLLDIYYLN